jgi:hypothetical protein
MHKYMHAIPGCWARYGTLLAWRGDIEPSKAQRVIDTYAVQHATNPDRRNRQSVAVHLMSLCASIEHDVSAATLRKTIGSWAHREYPLLDPRPDAFPVTVRDVTDAREETRAAVASHWAVSTWQAWAAHHAQVHTWLAEFEPSWR